MQTFPNKASVNTFLHLHDDMSSIVKTCTKAVKVVEKEAPALYDEICEMIESAQKSCRRYGGQFVATIWGEGFTQISYDAGRVPKAYAFVCILKQKLPE